MPEGLYEKTILFLFGTPDWPAALPRVWGERVNGVDWARVVDWAHVVDEIADVGLCL